MSKRHDEIVSTAKARIDVKHEPHVEKERRTSLSAARTAEVQAARARQEVQEAQEALEATA